MVSSTQSQAEPWIVQDGWPKASTQQDAERGAEPAGLSGSEPENSMKLMLGAAEVDLDLGAVTGPDGAERVLRRQSAAILRLLVAKRGAVLRKSEIYDAVWRGIAVTDNSLVQCVTEIRRALGVDRGLLATVQGVGYRLRPTDAAVSSVPPARAGGVPSLAVVAIAAPEAEAVWGPALTGFVENLADDLARRPEVRVIAAIPGARLDPRVDLARAARDSGARYLVLCRLTSEAEGGWLTVQLLEAAATTVLCSERHRLDPGAPASVLRLRAAAVAGLIAGVEGEIIRSERARLRRAARRSDDPYELYALASEDLEVQDRPAALAALALAERCTAVEPRFADGWLVLNYLRHRLFSHGWGDARPDRLAHEEAVFRRAVELEPRDPVAVGFLGVSLAKSGRAAEARRLVERAEALAAHRPDAGAELSFPLSAVAGRAEDALRLLDRAYDRHPRPPAHWGYMEARAAFFAGRFERAVAASDLSPDCLPKLVFRTLALARLGDAVEAAASLRALRALVPSFDFAAYARDLPDLGSVGARGLRDRPRPVVAHRAGGGAGLMAACSARAGGHAGRNSSATPLMQ